MGVEGLWKLLDQVDCGNPVSLETLENIILAIDCSIWLHQIIKGTRDENDYLLNIFRRICKLMHYKIKPVFVFDGGVPELKRRTIQSRKFRNDDLVSKQFDRLKKYVKDKHNVNIDLKAANLRSTKLSKFRDDDKMFQLADNVVKNYESDETESDDDFEDVPLQVVVDGKKIKLEDQKPQFDQISNHLNLGNLTNVDTNSDDFLSLPPELRHEMLIEIKEMKKFNLDECNKQPENLGDYSTYQIDKLIKSRDIQKQIEKTRAEMIGQCDSSVGSKEEYEKYISTRIASDEFTKLVFTKKRSPEVKTTVAKKVDKKCEKKNDSNIYGTVEEFDYDLAQETNPEAKRSSINDRIKRKVEIKKEEVSDSSSDDDDDFITVQDGTIEDNSIDDLNFTLSTINPVLLMNEKKIIESTTPTQLLANSISPKKLKSPDLKRPREQNDSIDLNEKNKVESIEKTKKNQQTPFVDSQKTSLEETTFDITITQNENKTIVLEDTPEKEVPSTSKNLNRSEIVLLESDEDAISDTNQNDDDDFFDQETKFEEDLNKFLNKIDPQSPAKKATQETASEPFLTIDFLENENDELASTVDQNLIDKITSESPAKSIKLGSESGSSSNTPKKNIKMVHLKPPTDDEQVNRIKSKPVDLSETLQLMRDIKKVKRQTNTVENSLIEETKELLNLFGIPYIISPMEAEAQCAVLEQLNLTKGTITDDGDVWLFGAKTVYKNFYNQSKFVVKYTAQEIEERLKLSRENLICFAMLTGSDYTDGIRGIGPVSATEIISEFNGEKMQPLIDFKQYWQDKKNGRPKKANKTREKFLKYDLPKSFPNQIIFNAYMNPEVDRSSEAFKFGKPDLDLLRRFTRERFHWSKEKQDSELLPLFKRINDSSTQTKISSFFQVIAKNREPDKVDSKRLQKALDKKSKEVVETIATKVSTTNGVRKGKTKKGELKKVKESKETNNDKASTLKSKVVNQRKKRTNDNAAAKIPSIFGKNVKISCFLDKAPASSNSGKSTSVSNDVICLSEDSE